MTLEITGLSEEEARAMFASAQARRANGISIHLRETLRCTRSRKLKNRTRNQIARRARRKSR